MTAAKRALDLAGAAIGLVLLAPVLGLTALLVRLADGPPVLFRQERVGPGGTFQLLKFRTMRGEPGRPITAGNDPRITPLGQALRRWKLDELPQLVNVLRGEMSLVGPRPEVPQFVAGYTERERAILAYRPGLTDPASLKYRDEHAVLASAVDPVRYYREVILPAKLALSLGYARRATVLTDLGVLASTAWALLATRPAPPLPARPSTESPVRRKESSDALSL